MIEFFVPGIPIAQGSMVAVGKGAMRHSNKNLRGWREAVGVMARSAGAFEQGGAIDITLLFFMPAPKMQKRDLPHVRPDLDKLTRAVLDALEGIAYKDDGQVCRITARKRYNGVGEPGVMIRLEQM